MNRRELLHSLATGSLLLFSGCGDYEDGTPPGRTIHFRIQEVRPVDDGYQLSIAVSNGRIPTVVIEDVTLLAFSGEGNQVCSESVGRIDTDRMKVDVTVHCSAFPEIITADAATSVCEELTIPLIYWVGTDEQTQKHVPDELSEDAVVWDSTVRKCGEALPPERFVNESGATEPNQ